MDRGLIAVLAGLLACVNVNAHPDRIERELLVHYATGTHKIENGKWEDLTHKVTARVLGEPRLENLGSAQALMFDGDGDYLEIGKKFADSKAFLPVKEFSASAWVMLNEPEPEGGIVGFTQDNGEFEKGWLLGYNREVFAFSLATKGVADPDGKLTVLTGKTKYRLGFWHHVLVTYDGSVMRLYVDGKLDAESSTQSGEILYPENGPYVIGAYVDDNEKHFMDGGLYEVKVYGRVLTAEELQADLERNKGLLAFNKSINTDLSFVVKPYLQFATRNSMVIMCETSKPARMTVEYAERQPLTNRVQTTATSAIHELELEKLKPGTIYFYRVVCTDEAGNIARGDVHSFQTAPDEKTPWAFGILGDTQRNPEVTRKCAEGIFALRPNLMIHCGDVVDDGFAKHQWVEDLFEPASRLFAYVPCFPVIGNHEKNSHWYYDYFSLTPPEYFYTFKYGNAEFFMIDSNKDCSPGSEQYKKLEAALKASTATWKFSAHHHPCFSSDEDDYGDHWRGKKDKDFTYGDSNARMLVPLYEKYGVDINFTGHIHSYERTWPIWQMTINQKKGVRYVVSGGGGGGLEQAAPQRAWFTLHVKRGHHYCFAAVHDKTIAFKAYDMNGLLFDAFELTKED